MIVVPLQNFNLCAEQDYVFSCQKYKIRKLIPESDIIDVELFSKQDQFRIRKTFWVIESSEINSHVISEEINLILIAIKVLFRQSIYVKYRICKENVSKCRRLAETLCYTNTESDEQLQYSDLKNIDYGFECLKEMRNISNRTYNALYFLYRGFFSYHWRDSYIFLVCFIESLFSINSSSGGNTKKICSRVARLIDDQKYSEDRINYIYGLRSDLIHGRIVPDPKSERNIDKVSELEELVIRIMDKVLNEKIYLHFISEEMRSEYFKHLTITK